MQTMMVYLKKRLPPPDFLLAFTIIVQVISNLKVEDRMRGLAPNLSPLGLHLAWLVAKFICSNLASLLHLAGWLGERSILSSIRDVYGWGPAVDLQADYCWPQQYTYLLHSLSGERVGYCLHETQFLGESSLSKNCTWICAR